MAIQQKRRRVTLSPRNNKKRSDYLPQNVDTVQMPGERELTTTGYRVPAFKNGSFETFYEVMLAGTSTNRLLHEKKDKVLWVLSGQGFLETQSPDGEPAEVKQLVAGDHVAIVRGNSFRVTTAAKTSLELLVTQQIKYEAVLQVVEDTEVGKEASADDLMSNPRQYVSRAREFHKDEPTLRRTSKAAQQQVADRTSRGRVGGGHPPVNEKRAADVGFSSYGNNLRPSGGKFDAEGAG